MELPRFGGGLTSPQDWLDGLLPKLKAASPDAVKFDLLLTIQDLCQRSSIWREWVGPITVDGRTIQIPVEPPYDNVRIHTIIQLRLGIPNGEYLGFIDHRNRSTLRRGGDGIPSKWFQPKPGLIVLDRMPVVGKDPAVPLEGLISLVPLDLCVPEWLKTEHYDTITKGTLQRQYGTRGPNYDPVMMKTMEREYIKGRSAAREAAYSGFSTAPTVYQRPYVFPSLRR